MIKELDQTIRDICMRLFDEQIDPQISRPGAQFGDFTTNVGLRLAGKLGKNPSWIADEIAKKLESHESIADVSVAGAGFINISLTDGVLLETLDNQQSQPLKNKSIVVEFSDPNPFKILHAGHLYTSIIGESIARLVEAGGGTVHRVNYGGDVGLHVAKAMWSILQTLGGENSEKLSNVSEEERSEWLAQRYIEGAREAKDNKNIIPELVTINKKIYQIHADKDHESALSKIYWTTRQWSYDYFEDFYEQINIKFEKYYPESQVFELGMEKVKQNVGEVYVESDGAIVFKGEEYGLHTRVFITKEDIPTYEAKEVGLAFTKKADYEYDLSVIVTANEIMQYMQVVQKSIEQFAPKLVEDTVHINHGVVKLPGGVKMSSRKGNILRAVDLIELAEKANKEQNDSDDSVISLGAIKYAFLKNRIGGDVVYNPDEVVSLEGNSGPYVQYALTRGTSILNKAGDQRAVEKITEIQESERNLVRKLSSYQDVYTLALNEFAPHYICTYLFELCQEFNRFYEKNRVLDDERTIIRLKLVQYYCNILQNGLNILGIQAPKSM